MDNIYFKRIDDLGRIQIPKQIRKEMGIKKHEDFIIKIDYEHNEIRLIRISGR